MIKKLFFLVFLCSYFFILGVNTKVLFYLKNSVIYEKYPGFICIPKDSPGTNEDQKNVGDEALLGAILSTNNLMLATSPEGSKEQLKEFCEVFATTVKCCHDLKIKGITKLTALSMIDQELILAGIKSMSLRIIEQIRDSLRQACVLGYHLPIDAVNIEKTYFNYCMNCNGKRGKITEIEF